MTSYSWATATSGDWNTGTLWTGGVAPNEVTADVTIDVTAGASPYIVTIGTNESFTIDSLTINDTTATSMGANSDPYDAAELNLDGTLTFAPGSAGIFGNSAAGGSLQTYILTDFGANAEIVNAGTIDGFIQVAGDLLLTGTNGVYITNDVQAQGTVTIDTKSIAELSGTVLFDGIYQAVGPGAATINLGGTLEGLIVNVTTLEGPQANPSGWTELTFNGPDTVIDEWNGTAYIPIESTLTEIRGGATVDVLTGRDYTTASTLTIDNLGASTSGAGMLNLQAGTVTTAGLIINGGIVQGAATIVGSVANNGTVIAEGGTLTLTGSLTGTGVVDFDYDDRAEAPVTGGATLVVNSVAAGEVFTMDGDDTLVLNAPASFLGTIAAKVGDKITLTGATVTSATISGESLIVRDGTATVATIALSGSYADEQVTVAGSTLTFATGTALPPAQTELLFQNVNGQLALWQMNGTAIATSGLLGANPGSSALAVGTGAFYAGDTSDVVLQNQDGSVAVWEVQGSTVLGQATVAANPGTSWHIKGTGSFYADGNTDILWQNDNGSVALWDMNGSTIVQSALVVANPGPTWHIEGTGNFYGDGNTDIVWQNDNGSVALWDMSGSTIVQSGLVSADPGTTWHIKGTGDFYGDGNTDILWQNDNGSVAIWDMHGTTIVQSGLVAANPGSTWHIEGTGDFNSDGKTDIAWQSDSGAVAVWEMNGTNVAASGLVATPGTSWNLLGSDENMRFIYSGAAGETLAATPQASDEFVFNNFAAGDHTITGFSTTQDMIELSGAQFASFADVQAATTAVPGGAVINLGNSSSLLLPGVDPSTLHASNFALA